MAPLFSLYFLILIHPSPIAHSGGGRVGSSGRLSGNLGFGESEAFGKLRQESCVRLAEPLAAALRLRRDARNFSAVTRTSRMERSVVTERVTSVSRSYLMLLDVTKGLFVIILNVYCQKKLKQHHVYLL